MKQETLTIEEIKQKTMELLGTTNIEDVAYITESYLEQDFKELDDSLAEKTVDENGKAVLVWYGQNMSYGHHSQHGPIYKFTAGNPPTNINNACGNGNWWCTFALWNHYGTDKRCGSAEYQRILKFVNEGS